MRIDPGSQRVLSNRRLFVQRKQVAEKQDECRIETRYRFLTERTTPHFCGLASQTRDISERHLHE